MLVPQTTTVYSVEDLARLDGDFELDHGMLVPVMPGGGDHGLVCTRACCRIGVFVDDRGLGQVYVNDTGFVLSREPDTMRGPDIAFVRRKRVADLHAAGFLHGAPDLAIEIVGTGTTLTEAIRKATQYLEAGSSLVWLFDITHRRVLEFAADGVTRTMTESETLHGAEVLPGFSWSVRSIFEGLSQARA